MEPTHPAAPSVGAPVERPQTVLVVDDEEDITTALRDTLQAYLDPVDVLVALSGPQALEVLRGHKVDLIVTDFKMPGMNGLEFLRKARELAPNVPRIMITAFPDIELVVKALNDEHILNFIPKPLRTENVIQVVAAALAERQAQGMRNKYLAASLQAMRRGET